MGDRDRAAFRPADRVLQLAENSVYALVGLLLVAGAVVVLVTVAYHLVSDLDDGAEAAVAAALDGLLLVFILLELVAGVRATIVQRRLVAEPFLIVGIIASIKEIIVIALAAESDQAQRIFRNSMVEMGVLGGLVVLLAFASFLVRRKEREPDE